MSIRQTVTNNLVAAFLAGAWSNEALLRRGAAACGESERRLRGHWLRPLVRDILTRFPAASPRPDPQVLARAIEGNRRYHNAWNHYATVSHTPLCRVYWIRPQMVQAGGTPSTWQLPPFTTTAALADWLGLTHGELDWFADCHGREVRVPVGPLRHYTYHWLKGRAGKRRLLEMPKHRLKEMQRRLLHDILDRISPHNAAHGFRRGRSVVTYAAAHCGKRIVIRFDLRAFFPSIRASRVHALFRTAGYPRDVARVLTGLCTNRVPEEVWQTLSAEERARSDHETNRLLYRTAHLPQGAPTSPALANLCAYRLDCRLDALARSLNGVYTRYGDDLAFSGGEELERGARRFQVLVCRIALEEGFTLQTRKSRFMRQGVRQQLAGVVVNAHPNLCRAEYDRLKAILTNCVRHGPASQNRDGHADFRGYLAGRIAYVQMLNAARGQRLHELYARIQWQTD
jgi:RNA-directed DNA polymerase